MQIAKHILKVIAKHFSKKDKCKSWDECRDMAKLYEGREGQSKGSSGGRVQSLVDMRQVKAITKIQFPTKNPINKHPASKS
jgi:hypothetical protein